MINLCEMIGASFILIFVLLITSWCIYFARREESIADLFWAISLMGISWLYFFLGDGAFLKKLTVAAMVSLWGARLSTLLYERIQNGVKSVRYEFLSEKWGKDKSGALFFMLFLLQGSIAIFLSLPFLIVAGLSDPFWSGWELVGVIVWGIGVAGEALSDEQLKKFKASQPDSLYKHGFWHFSRHPNYFFEWIVWVGFALFAIPTTGGWLGILSPIVMYILLNKISGIPMTEALLVKKYGEAYLTYQETTSSFFPWFPENTKLEGSAPKEITAQTKD